jgi:transposase
LLADEGRSDGQIINALKIARNTVKQVKGRYKKEGIEFAIHEKPRSGAPAKWDGKQKAKITALACSKPPEGRSGWTLRLLADRVVELGIVDNISHTSIGQTLKKTN